MPPEQDDRPGPARRGQPHRGHEYQLPSGTWAIRISLGGRRQLVTGETRTAVRRDRDALLARFRRGELAADPGAARQTLAAYLLSWLDGQRPQLEPSSWAPHRINVRTHLVPLLGRLKLEDVQPPDVRRALASIAAKGLGPRSVDYCRDTLHQALKQAHQNGLLPQNPVALVAPPKVPKREVWALTPGEAARLLGASGPAGAPFVAGGPGAADADRRALWTLAVYSGLRLGELLGLCWEDVDLAPADLPAGQGAVTVRRVLADDEAGMPVLRPYPKRAASVRRVPMPAVVVAELVAQRERVRRAQDRAGPGGWPDPAGLAFPSRAGTPRHRTNVNRRLKRDARAAGLRDGLHPHVLRHTFASWLLAAGRPITEVARLLGHGSPAVTLSTYAHWVRQDEGAAAAALERFAAGATETAG